MVSMAVVLGAAAIWLLIAGRPVLALIASVAAVAQVIAAVTAARGRALVTVLFIDVVNSTHTVTELGDVAWQEKFGQYTAIVRRELNRVPAAFIKDLGDGFLAVFPIVVASPGRVVAAAVRVASAASGEGLMTRTGIHAGECSLTRRDARGLAVHAAARLLDAAEPGQVVISGAVRELLGGTDLGVKSLGERQFKGLSEPMRVYLVSAEREPTAEDSP